MKTIGFVGSRALILSTALVISFAYAGADKQMLDGEPNHPQLRKPSSLIQIQKRAESVREATRASILISLKAPSEVDLNALHEKNSRLSGEQAFQIGVSRMLDEREVSRIADAIADVAEVNELGFVGNVQVSSQGAKAIRLRIDFADDLSDDTIFRFIGSEELDQGQDAHELTGRQIKSIWSGEHFFWAPVTFGEVQGIQVTLPPGTDKTLQSFTVTAVSHLVYSPLGPIIGKTTSLSGTCEFDVACYPASPEATTAKTVAKMLFSNTLGSFTCTGTLLNDADPRTYVPYFYTANHCISTQAAASSLITYWRFEASACGSGIVANFQTLQLGAFLYFTDYTTDATLLALNEDAPAGAYFSGWNANLVTATNPSTTIGIHHPAGDVKKLSVANSSLGYGPYNGAGSFILTTWLSGVTEPGSSGSGIFTRTGVNGDYQLRGGLKGGNSSCANPVGIDEYSRLDLVYPALQPLINGPIMPLTTLAIITPSSSAIAQSAPVTLTARMVILAGYPYATGSLAFYDGVNFMGSALLQQERTAYPYTVVAALTASSLSNGVHSITVSYAGDSNFGPATSAAIVITVGASNLLINPGFETGAVGWSQSSGGGYSIINNEGIVAHGGVYDAWLGGYNLANDALSQNGTIPLDSQYAFLQFWYKIATAETSAISAYDFLTVDLYSVATGTKLTTLITLSNLDAGVGWRQSALLDVSAYKGQNVKLQFTATTDLSLITNFRIDDVSLSVIRPPALQPPTIAMVNPASGPQGAIITLSGINFASGATVTVGGMNAVITGAITSTSLQFIVPNVPAGIQNIVLNVNGAMSVPVAFTVTASTYFVTPTAGSNGTITPNTVQTIMSGNSTVFSVVPNANYSVSVMGTCGGTLLGTTYTTNPVSASCSVDAAFSFVTRVPDAPLVVAAFPGNGQATIIFNPPAFDGGLPISGYTSVCNPGTVTSAGVSSPITITGLTNSTPYVCFVTANNSAGSSIASSAINVTPSAGAPLTLVAVQSRKTHGNAGIFDLMINTSPAINEVVTVESRANLGGHKIVFQFNGQIFAAGTVSAVGVDGLSVGNATAVAVNNSVEVSLVGVPDKTRVKISLTGVNSILNPNVSIGLLVGGVSGNASVSSADLSGVRLHSGQTTNINNFKFDLNTSGAINASDVSGLKARIGATMK